MLLSVLSVPSILVPPATAATDVSSGSSGGCWGRCRCHRVVQGHAGRGEVDAEGVDGAPWMAVGEDLVEPDLDCAAGDAHAGPVVEGDHVGATRLRRSHDDFPRTSIPLKEPVELGPPISFPLIVKPCPRGLPLTSIPLSPPVILLWAIVPPVPLIAVGAVGEAAHRDAVHGEADVISLDEAISPSCPPPTAAEICGPLRLPATTLRSAAEERSGCLP